MKTLIQEIKVAKQKTEKRREEWNQNSRGIIFDTLNKAVNELGLLEIGGSVIRIEKYIRLEEVRLSLGIEASGIVKKNQDGGLRAFIKNNGYISFEQLISGKIAVICKPCWIEEIGREPIQETKETIEPSTVTEAWVLDHVRDFLIEVKEYEESWI